MALVYITHHELKIASYLILLAALFDFADGLAARLLNAYSPIGKQLDSLADVVSFGLVPGFMLYFLMADSNDIFLLKNPWLQFLPFLLTIFAALRLAKFNIDTRQTEGFIGLPTPASTLFVIAIPLIESHDNPILQMLINPAFVLPVTVFLSVLMVSELPMFSLKFKQTGWQKNKVRYIFLALVVILFLLFKFLALPFSILLYIIISIFIRLIPANKNNIPH